MVAQKIGWINTKSFYYHLFSTLTSSSSIKELLRSNLKTIRYNYPFYDVKFAQVIYTQPLCVALRVLWLLLGIFEYSGGNTKVWWPVVLSRLVEL